MTMTSQDFLDASMRWRPDVVASWQAAEICSTFTNYGGEYSFDNWVANPEEFCPSPHVKPSQDSDLVFTMIVCDSGDDVQLKNTLASILGNDLSSTQIVLAGPARRQCELAMLLVELGAAGVVDLHIDVYVTSFEELESSALRAAGGEFICLLTAGDLLERHALALLEATVLQESRANIIFTDEDWIDENGNRCCPRLKTGWDPDAHLGRDHFGQLCLLRRERVEEAGGLRVEHSPAHHYDLRCRVAFSVPPPTILHVPVVLCHRAIPRVETSGEDVGETYRQAARIVAQLAAQQLCGESVEVTPAPLTSFINRVHWPLAVPAPFVSIVVPTRDRADLLSNCISGLLDRTAYDNFEVLILDNDSVERATFRLLDQLAHDRRVRVVPTPGPFNFSRINNAGVREARGEVLIFMNNDIEIVAEGWLREMVSHALRPDVGCVGARLLYGDQHVQHAGIVLQPGPLAMHVFRRRHETEVGFDAQLAGTRTYAAVTAACLAVRRALFDRVGGFDEQDLQVSFQDVDLCLKIEEIGYRNICTPFEPLLHLEGSSRAANSDDQARQQRELRCLMQRWSDRFHDDSFGHPFIHLDWEKPERLMRIPEGQSLLDLIR